MKILLALFLLQGTASALEISAGASVVNGSPISPASVTSSTATFDVLAVKGPSTFGTQGASTSTFKGNVGIAASLAVTAQSNGVTPSTFTTNGTATANSFAWQRSDSAVSGSCTYQTADGAEVCGSDTAHDFAFKTNGTENVRIKSGGNVGIGTTSPASKLHMSSGTLTVDGTSPTLNLGDGTNAGTEVNIGSAAISGRLAVGSRSAAPTATIVVSSMTGVFKFATLSLASGQSIALNTTFGTGGILNVQALGITSNATCIFRIKADSNAANVISDPDTLCAATDTASKISIVVNGDSTYNMKNNLAGTESFAIQFVGR